MFVGEVEEVTEEVEVFGGELVEVRWYEEWDW